MSDLTNTFIANTYQKLLQYDNINGSVGTTAQFNMADAISSSKYNLLNGLGQTMPGFVIDTTGNGNGGLMFKDTNSDPGGLWSIQTYETSINEGGLNFWRPSGAPNSGNAKLFLKNTGSVWVGYQGSGNPVIPTDITGYSLYVKDGIYVTGSTPSIRMDNNSSQFLVRQNTYLGGQLLTQPMQIVKISFSGTNGNGGDPAGNILDLGIPTAHYFVCIVGFESPGGDQNSSAYPGFHAFNNGANWGIRTRLINVTGSTTHQVWLLIIHRTLCNFQTDQLFAKPGGGSINWENTYGA